jgi:hypothetical protein
MIETELIDKIKFAEILDVSVSTINSYQKNGIIQIHSREEGRGGRILYEYPDCVQKVVRYLSETAARRTSSVDDPLKQAKILDIEMNIELKRIDLNLAQGNIIPLDRHIEIVSTLIKGVSMFLGSMPDVLERTCNIDARTVDEVAQTINNKRLELYEKLENSIIDATEEYEIGNVEEEEEEEGDGNDMDGLDDDE